MERPFDVPDHGLVCDMLWSDPDEVMYANNNFERSMLPCGTKTGAYNQGGGNTMPHLSDMVLIQDKLEIYIYLSLDKYKVNILKAKSNFTLVLYIPFLGIGEWYFKCV